MIPLRFYGYYALPAPRLCNAAFIKQPFETRIGRGNILTAGSQDGIIQVESEMLNVIANPARDVTYELEGTKFVWDDEKYRINYSKHRVTFEEAATRKATGPERKKYEILKAGDIL
jgi:hypothetical protein